MQVNDLQDYGGSRELIEALTSIGLKELYPPQVSAIEAGLLRGNDSFVVSAPTASGKTLIAEMATLKVFFEKTGKVLYLVPLRALAREKYEDFKGKYKAIGMKVMQSTGDYDSRGHWLHEADLIVLTNEKLDSLVRHQASWLGDVSLVIADEIHLLGDSHRGHTLEVVLTRLRATLPSLRVIGLSATIANAGELAGWLNARLIRSYWRPVPLREGVYFNGAGVFNDGTVKWIPQESRSEVIDLGLDTIREGGQALIFVSTRKATEAVARKACIFVSPTLPENEMKNLMRLSEHILGASPEPTRLCRRLAESVANGVAFHHAGINSSQRRLIEDAFRANKIKLIASTTTLAMGLNLPSRRVIVRDWRRYESGMGLVPIPAIEIKQMSGRAGRPGFDKYGEAVIVARSKKDEQYLFDRYIRGGPEKIESRLANEPALRAHILASIAGAFTRSRTDLMDFLKETFLSYQRGADYLYSSVLNIIDFLKLEEMVIERNDTLDATRFGRRISELYIDPLSGVLLRDCLQHTGEKKTFPLLHMIARVPDMMHLTLKKKDHIDMLDVFHTHADKLLIPEAEKYPSEKILSEIKTAFVLMQWTLETHEDKLTDHFDIGPGDLRTLIERSDWLLYSAGEIARVFGLRDAEKDISRLRPRVIYGVKEELLELVSLRGIGRIKARNLYSAGFTTIKDIKGTTVKKLSEVPAIGMAIAEDMKRQVEKSG